MEQVHAVRQEGDDVDIESHSQLRWLLNKQIT